MAAIEERARSLECALKRAALIAGCVLSASCGRNTIPLPDVPGSQSVVLIIDGPTPAVEAHDLDAPNRRIPADDAELLTAVFYAHPLAAFDLSEGSVAHYDGEDARRLPGSDRLFQRPAGASSWQEGQLVASALYERFRIAPESPKTCATYGGCYPNPDDPACVSPCPEPMELVSPLIPPSTLPELTPCPADWREVTIAGVVACEPHDEESCPPLTFPFLGGACEEIESDCALDGWPVIDPSRTTTWVRQNGNGSGTRAEPLGTIAAALAIAPGGSIIALARGRYAESFALDSGRELIGTCASEVVVAGTITAGEAAIRKVHVEGMIIVESELELDRARLLAAPLGIEVRERATIDVRRSVIDASAGGLIAGAGARVTIDDSVFDAQVVADFTSATATISNTRLAGEIRVSGGALFIFDSELVRNEAAALSARSAANIVGSRLVIRGVGDAPAITGSNAHVRLQKTRIEAGLNAYFNEQSGYATLEHVLLLQSRRNDSGTGMRSEGGVVVARRVLVEGSDAAFSVVATNLTVTESTIRKSGRAVTADDGAEVRVDTSRIQNTDGWAITINGVVDRPGDTYQLQDLEFRDIHGAVRALRSQVGRLARIRVIGASEPMFEAGRQESAPVVFAEDLELEKFICDRSESDCGVLSIVQGSLDLNRFYFHQLDSPAIVLHQNGAARLSNGRIVNAPVGIDARGADRDLRALLDRVTFDEVGVVCEPCGR